MDTGPDSGLRSMSEEHSSANDFLLMLPVPSTHPKRQRRVIHLNRFHRRDNRMEMDRGYSGSKQRPSSHYNNIHVERDSRRPINAEPRQKSQKTIGDVLEYEATQ